MLLSSQWNVMRCCIVLCNSSIGAWYRQGFDEYEYEYKEQVSGPGLVSVHPYILHPHHCYLQDTNPTLHMLALMLTL